MTTALRFVKSTAILFLQQGGESPSHQPFRKDTLPVFLVHTTNDGIKEGAPIELRDQGAMAKANPIREQLLAHQWPEQLQSGWKASSLGF